MVRFGERDDWEHEPGLLVRQDGVQQQVCITWYKAVENTDVMES